STCWWMALVVRAYKAYSTDGTTAPIMRVRWLRSDRAPPWGRYRSLAAAARTRSSVSGSTLPGLFSALETVAVDTPASCATSFEVERDRGVAVRRFGTGLGIYRFKM